MLYGLSSGREAGVYPIRHEQKQDQIIYLIAAWILIDLFLTIILGVELAIFLR